VEILFVVIVIAAVLSLLVALKAKQTKPDNELGYVSRDALFSPAFLGVLEQALDSRYRVFGKVRLGDIVKPAKGLSPSKRTTAMNRINQKHVDFVICAAADLALVGVVELDDKSHGREDRAKRDGLVDQALDMARIPIVHFPVKNGYAVQEVQAKLSEILPNDVKPVVTPRLQKEPDLVPQAIVVNMQYTEPQPEPTVPTTPVCPKCTTVMVKRQAAKGEHAGKWFWACSAFPKCRQVVAIGVN
jgi:hypothetical protein